MRSLRNARLVWAWREGRIEDHGLDPFGLLTALVLLEQAQAARAP
jgi:hypothetical protein